MHAFDFVPLGVYLPSLASCLLAADRQQHFFLTGCGLAPWNLRFRLRNKWPWFCLGNGTRTSRLSQRSTEPGQPVSRKMPTVIDRAWETGRAAIFKIINQDSSWEVCHALTK
jgi:hypothetical protein